MLTNGVVIRNLAEVIGDRQPEFNIDILLFLLKYTTRIIGYPNYKDGDNSKFPVSEIRQRLNHARRIRNGDEFETLMSATRRLLSCFAYFKNSLGTLSDDQLVIDLLLEAINMRDDITDEENCAERSLLLAMVEDGKDILILVDEYWTSMRPINIFEIACKEFTFFGNKYIKNVVNSIPLTQELSISNEVILQATSFVKDKIKATDLLKPYVSSKELLKNILVNIVLQDFANERQSDWLIQSNILNKSCLMVEQQIQALEQARTDVRQYIAVRQSEWEIGARFKKYPKSLKLESANKYLEALSNNCSQTFFSSKEQAALSLDSGSRLTNLFREQNILSFNV